MNIKKIIKNTYLQKQINKERNHEEELNLPENWKDRSLSLTKDEINIAINLWGGALKLTSFKELEVYKYFNGFDPRYVSHNMYLPLISRRLNNYHYTKFFEDKGLLGCLSDCGIQFPHCLVRCINGEFYDENLFQISTNEAARIIFSFGGDVIQKISRESSGGHGVKKIKLSEMPESEKDAAIKKMLSSPIKDYVIQKSIVQSPVMAQFNATSVNTFRIITLYLNGHVSHCYTLLRVGQSGSEVDNMCSGGIGIGINNDGSLHQFGFNYALQKIDTFNGVKLIEKSIPQYSEILEKVLLAHKKNFSLCKFIGWDIAINEKNEPIIIEVNTSQPGIFVGQLNNGPVFGERTQEVIEYIKTKSFIY